MRHSSVSGWHQPVCILTVLPDDARARLIQQAHCEMLTSQVMSQIEF